MANKFQENIEPEEAIVDFNPLDEAVNEKRYTQPNVNTAGVDFNIPIEEPRFTPPPFQKSTISSNEKGGKQEQQKREPLNPEMKNLSKKDTEMAAEQAAKMLIQGYEWLHVLGNKGLQVSEKKLNRLQADGEINLNAMIDYDYGKKIRAGEFFQAYNEQVANILTVTDEFKEEVTPVLQRVLAKRGIGLTDEQLLMYLFGKDIAAKSIVFFQQKSQLNYMIQSIKEATMNQYTPPPPPSTPPPTPKKEESVIVEPEEYMVDMKQRVEKKEEKAEKKTGRGRPKKI